MLQSKFLDKSGGLNYANPIVEIRRPHVVPVTGRCLITKREREVLEFISDGMTNQEIAKEMHLSPHTTESHRRHLMNKLEARNQANLVKIGMERGLI